ncbi:DUF2189 domain-containing protein [Kordiimonas sp. SCSIO 12610]|uniref:DUF2189 domain-containing protein n=1 Tax=Kordiimonas sp. SCSIO 12610 TaxID=2829597 RepID=UPI00210A3B0B|nr:DUF2189 domain-containing protein [Kordiimonas sp. SCSIO 12610]UTW55707.1 DUF2189 domain-containing protein [Kordiimonas sp. SCSIO 12610]
MSDITVNQENKRPTMAKDFAMDLPITAPFDWLRRGVQDTFTSPISSLAYGFAVFLVSIAFVVALLKFGFSYILFPVIASFMVLGPMVAIGLYGKSRLLALGSQHITITDMISVKAKSPKALMLVSIVLLFVMTFWLRAAVMIYALFFGLEPFSGVEETINALLFTDTGRIMLLVGSIAGGALAALSFSLSAFSLPMLMNEKKDTMTAMALSVVIAWMNKPVAFLWGTIVLGFFLLSFATGFLGLIVIFPILGHATWHAYTDLRSDEALAAANP